MSDISITSQIGSIEAILRTGSHRHAVKGRGAGDLLESYLAAALKTLREVQRAAALKTRDEVEDERAARAREYKRAAAEEWRS